MIKDTLKDLIAALDTIAAREFAQALCDALDAALTQVNETNQKVMEIQEDIK